MKNKIQSFFLGLFAALIAVVIEIAIYSSILNKTYALDFALLSMPVYLVLFALVEELSKLVIIAKTIFPISNNKRDAIYLSIFMGLGFGITEMAFLYTKQLEPFSWLNSLAVIILHVGTSGIFGSIWERNNLIKIGQALIITTAAHSAFNEFALKSNSANNSGSVLILIMLALYICVSLIKKRRTLLSL